MSGLPLQSVPFLSFILLLLASFSSLSYSAYDSSCSLSLSEAHSCSAAPPSQGSGMQQTQLAELMTLIRPSLSLSLFFLFLLFSHSLTTSTTSERRRSDRYLNHWSCKVFVRCLLSLRKRCALCWDGGLQCFFFFLRACLTEKRKSNHPAGQTQPPELRVHFPTVHSLTSDLQWTAGNYNSWRRSPRLPPLVAHHSLIMAPSCSLIPLHSSNYSN